MSREKQIDEMATVIANTYLPVMQGVTTVGEICLGCGDAWRISNALYNAGYRKQEWISVDERLPEESDWYLVNIIAPFDFEFVSISHYSQGYGWNNPDTITHWMPLPEAPKMKGGAE